MRMAACTTPVLLITYKRLDTTEKVMDSIALVKPEKLYIANNAPNPAKPDDHDKVMAVRKMLESRITWPCKVEKLYRTTHLSAKDSIWSSIQWLFENEEEGIILEDDVLADETFYRFAGEMLELYRNDTRIRFINGCNFGFKENTGNSYGYTRFMNMWGWASWRRSINLVDQSMQAWKNMEDKNGFLEKVFEKQQPRLKQMATSYFRKIFDETSAGKIDTWDYQSIYSNLLTETYAIYPSVNLVNNLGFGNDGTHTNFNSYFLSEMKTRSMNFPLQHPSEMNENNHFQEFLLERWAGLRFRSRIYYSVIDKAFKIKRALSGKSF